MMKMLAVSTLLLASAIGFAQPAAARDRDDYQNGNRYRVSDNRGYAGDRGGDRARSNERAEWSEHERSEDRSPRYVDNYRYSSGYAGNYSNGYYDRFGNWCQY